MDDPKYRDIRIGWIRRQYPVVAAPPLAGKPLEEQAERPPPTPEELERQEILSPGQEVIVWSKKRQRLESGWKLGPFNTDGSGFMVKGKTEADSEFLSNEEILAHNSVLKRTADNWRKYARLMDIPLTPELDQYPADAELDFDQAFKIFMKERLKLLPGGLPDDSNINKLAERYGDLTKQSNYAENYRN